MNAQFAEATDQILFNLTRHARLLRAFSSWRMRIRIRWEGTI